MVIINPDELKHSEPFPETLTKLAEELAEHAKDGRSDALFRVPIMLDNVGAFVRYISHDQELNPVSHPHGTKQDEINAAGHMIVQVLTLAILRGIDIQEAVNVALVNLRGKDFIKRESENLDIVKGIIASIPEPNTGFKHGIAVVPTDDIIVFVPDSSIENYILILSHAQSDPRIAKFDGLITDHGGINCHGAIIAREYSIPCIVGTGNATKKIKSGDCIYMNLTTGEVIIED